MNTIETAIKNSIKVHTREFYSFSVVAVGFALISGYCFWDGMAELEYNIFAYFFLIFAALCLIPAYNHYMNARFLKNLDPADIANDFEVPEGYMLVRNKAYKE